MNLYLVRHAKAASGPIDWDRNLTHEGQAAAHALGATMRLARVRVDHIKHSPLVRAKQTAEILATHLETPLEESKVLAPDQPVEVIREGLVQASQVAQMLVGHNPLMEWLAALLITEDPDCAVLSFRTASAAKLVSNAGSLGRRFTCEWLVNPSLIPAVSS